MAVAGGWYALSTPSMPGLLLARNLEDLWLFGVLPRG